MTTVSLAHRGVLAVGRFGNRDPMNVIARRTGHQRRRPSPYTRKVGDHIGRFEACSTFTRVTACQLAEPPKRPVCLEGFDGFVSSPRRFDSYRLERPSCRVGIAPTEDQHLCTAHE